jgi:hypothetical protein
MSCGEQGTTATARRQRACASTQRWALGRSLPPMFFTLTALAFGVAALILFIFAFKAVFAGKIGSAVVFGLLALVMCGVAGATSVAA